MHKSQKRKHYEEHGLSKKTFVLRCLITTVIFYIASIIIILVASAFAYRSEISFELTNILGKSALLISALICGILLTIINRQGKVIGGIFLSAFILLSLFIVSLFIKDTKSASNILWYALTFISCISGSMLGGLIVERAPKRKKHK